VLFIDNSRQCASSTEAFGEATGLEARGQGLDDGC